MTCGSRKQGQALSHHGCCPLQEHKTGDGRTQARVRDGLPIQASQRQATGQTGYGVPRQVQGYLRARVLLAPTQRMPVRDLAKDARGFLGRKVCGECGTRQANRKGIEEARLVRADRVAMSTERTGTIGEKAR